MVVGKFWSKTRSESGNQPNNGLEGGWFTDSGSRELRTAILGIDGRHGAAVMPGSMYCRFSAEEALL